MDSLPLFNELPRGPIFGNSTGAGRPLGSRSMSCKVGLYRAGGEQFCRAHPDVASGVARLAAGECRSPHRHQQ